MPHFTIGGGTEYVVNTVEGLYTKNIKSDIYTTRVDRDKCQRLIDRSKQCGNLFICSFSPIKFIFSQRGLKLIYENRKETTFHFHGIFSMQIGIFFKIIGKKCVYQPHGYWRSKKDNTKWYDILIDLLAIIMSHKIIITTPDEISNLPKIVKTIARKKSSIVLTRINHSETTNIKYNSSSNLLLCMAVKGFYQKGIDNLIDLMKLVKKNSIDVKLVHYYGSEGDAEFLKLLHQIEKEQISDIYELRKVVPNIWNETMNIAGVISLSRFEGRSLAIQETVIRGIPIIATECAGHMDLLDKEWSYLIDIEDVSLQFDSLLNFLGDKNLHLKANKGKEKMLKEPSSLDMAIEIYLIHNNM
jgi:glycosyltransferase involved in cell wall biosynthesis